MLKGSKIYSILTGTCPVCHEESMYTSGNVFNPKKTQEMHERCSNCGTKYKMEPSFFYGSMYVSYGVGVAIAIATFVITYFLFNMNRLNIFFVIMAILVIGMPVVIRLSRNIWINLFLDYDPDKANN